MTLLERVIFVFDINQVYRTYPEGVVEDIFGILGRFIIVEVNSSCFDLYWSGKSSSGVFYGCKCFSDARSLAEHLQALERGVHRE